MVVNDTMRMFISRTSANVVKAVYDVKGVSLSVADILCDIDPVLCGDFGKYGYEVFLLGNSYLNYWDMMVEQGLTDGVRPEFLYWLVAGPFYAENSVLECLSHIVNSYDLLSIYDTAKFILSILGGSDVGIIVAIFYLCYQSTITENYVVLDSNPFVKDFNIEGARWDYV